MNIRHRRKPLRLTNALDLTRSWKFLKEPRGGGYWIAVGGLHGIGVVLLALTLPRHPEIVALGLLAYALGARHAFDPDHIAAIDNSVRRFLQNKTHAHGSGFWFSIGHSSVVFLLAMGLAFGGMWAAESWPFWRTWGETLAQEGLDTASEVVLLSRPLQAADGLPWTGVVALPILFASAMSLFDTADSWMMSQVNGVGYLGENAGLLLVGMLFLMGTVSFVLGRFLVPRKGG